MRNEDKTRSKSSISWLFAVIWLLALAVVAVIGSDIPKYMLIVGTVFFFMLLPAMNDAVREYDKYLQRRKNTSTSNLRQSRSHQSNSE